MSISLFFILVTIGISIWSFQNPDIKYKLIFSPTIIEERKEWYRFLTCGFIHADYMHLLVNMYVFYMFGDYVEKYYAYAMPLGEIKYITMYLLTIVLANVRTFFKERHNHAYFSLGASGGISGIVFSYMLINPTAKLGLLFIPFYIPAYVFGPLYLLYSHYMSKRSGDNINHDAHLWGAVVGILFTAISSPDLVMRYFN
ncbi:MAG: rhomboid family intramembrane serine protease [Bacteroidetes bacterium]|nr:rhomboid family intramembrane serine protease [Bacteroidota bacterium]